MAYLLTGGVCYIVSVCENDDDDCWLLVIVDDNDAEED